MVVFVDFEGEDDDPFSPVSAPWHHGSMNTVRRTSQSDSLGGFYKHVPDLVEHKDVSSNGVLFASVLACYPASLSIASQLDLNDLCALSFTCRRIHDELSQFAHQLRTQSLHCTNDVPPKTSEEEVDTLVFEEALQEMMDAAMSYAGAPAYPLPSSVETNRYHLNRNSALGLSGKVGTCARDLVAPCRKCGIVVCRNCAVKPPSGRCLPNRFRRLCRTCLDAPLIDHLQPLDEDHDFHESPPASSASSTRSVRSASSSSVQSDRESRKSVIPEKSFTSPTFLRDPCDCASRGVHLCQPCGQSLVSGDTTYKRVWTWRSRYSTHIGGGLGTGLGLGNQGQKCGRGEHCLERGVAGVCWVEIDCSEAQGQSSARGDGFSISRSSTPVGGGGYESDGPIVNRPGYFSQELEGIGGVLKKKVKKRVKVGATVYEYDDERATGKYLARESCGKQRSWCGWCSRVCLGEADAAAADRLLIQRI